MLKDKDFWIGRLEELSKVIDDLAKAKLYSPFNEYFLRDCFVDRYKIRIKQLERKLGIKRISKDK